MTEINCPYCKSSSCKVEYDLTWKDERFATYHVARCGDCDVGFVLPLPTPDELNELYNSLQYHEEDRSTINYAYASDEVINSRVNKEGRILRKYAPHFPPTGKVLDIGAGWGTLLKFFANKGYQTVGLELSTVTSKFASDRLGLDIHNLPVEQLDQVPGGPFDLITMRHTLEHFYDPSRVLQSVSQQLVDGGKVIIEVPDYGSYDRKKYGTSWPAFGPYHLWYFTKTSLNQILEDNGFEVLKFHQFMSETVLNGKSFPSRIGRSVLNRMGGANWFSGRSIGLIAQKKQSS